LLLVDCCYSGGLAEAIARQPGRMGYACLTSSLASESSTGKWNEWVALKRIRLAT
jgi:hypothetical protein